MPADPKDLLQMGFYKKNVELIVGVVKNDGSFLAASKVIHLSKFNFESIESDL